MGQLNIETTSPINTERLKGQNRRLLDYFLTSKTIHCFHPAVRELRIGYLNSRCSDVTKFLKEHGQKLYRHHIRVPDADGQKVTVCEYGLQPFIN